MRKNKRAELRIESSPNFVSLFPTQNRTIITKPLCITSISTVFAKTPKRFDLTSSLYTILFRQDLPLLITRLTFFLWMAFNWFRRPLLSIQRIAEQQYVIPFLLPWILFYSKKRIKPSKVYILSLNSLISSVRLSTMESSS